MKEPKKLSLTRTTLRILVPASAEHSKEALVLSTSICPFPCI